MTEQTSTVPWEGGIWKSVLASMGSLAREPEGKDPWDVKTYLTGLPGNVYDSPLGLLTCLGTVVLLSPIPQSVERGSRLDLANRQLLAKLEGTREV